MFNPFGAMMRLIQQRRDEEARHQPTDQVRDVTQTDAYKAGLARGTEADARGVVADRSRAQALQALAAVRATPVQSAAPIAINMPSFTLGGRPQGRR